jgi:predicted enzyme related to lactoylglutathione lyase
MINAIAFTVYPVSDMARARRFYESALGLKVTMNFQEAWVEYDIASGTFAISTMMEGSVPGSKGASIAFEVDDFDAAVKRMQEQKVPFVVEPFETPVCRMAVIADPDGNAINLHKLKDGPPA